MTAKTKRIVTCLLIVGAILGSAGVVISIVVNGMSAHYAFILIGLIGAVGLWLNARHE